MGMKTGKDLARYEYMFTAKRIQKSCGIETQRKLFSKLMRLQRLCIGSFHTTDLVVSFSENMAELLKTGTAAVQLGHIYFNIHDLNPLRKTNSSLSNC